jgi:hypothetical protein
MTSESFVLYYVILRGYLTCASVLIVACRLAIVDFSSPPGDRWLLINIIIVKERSCITIDQQSVSLANTTVRYLKLDPRIADEGVELV